MPHSIPPPTKAGKVNRASSPAKSTLGHPPPLPHKVRVLAKSGAHGRPSSNFAVACAEAGKEGDGKGLTFLPPGLRTWFPASEIAPAPSSSGYWACLLGCCQHSSGPSSHCSPALSLPDCTFAGSVQYGRPACLSHVHLWTPATWPDGLGGTSRSLETRLFPGAWEPAPHRVPLLSPPVGMLQAGEASQAHIPRPPASRALAGPRRKPGRCTSLPGKAPDTMALRLGHAHPRYPGPFVQMQILGPTPDIPRGRWGGPGICMWTGGCWDIAGRSTERGDFSQTDPMGVS